MSVKCSEANSQVSDYGGCACVRSSIFPSTHQPTTPPVHPHHPSTPPTHPPPESSICPYIVHQCHYSCILSCIQIATLVQNQHTSSRVNEPCETSTSACLDSWVQCNSDIRVSWRQQCDPEILVHLSCPVLHVLANKTLHRNTHSRSEGRQESCCSAVSSRLPWP